MLCFKEKSKLLQPTATTTYACPPITSLRNSNSLTTMWQKTRQQQKEKQQEINKAKQESNLKKKNTTSKRSCSASEDIFLDLRKHNVDYTCTSGTRSKQRNAAINIYI
jgi:hypothetical protein